MKEHISVLKAEAIDGLKIKSDRIYVDGTLGRGGHSLAILSKLTTGKLYAFDKDQEAIDSINIEDVNFEIIKADFKDIKNELALRNIDKIDGLLLDIGVSSPQFDKGERGFSYRFDAKLDMRMDLSQKLNAYIIVNKYSETELVDIFYQYGEERYAKSIARNIIKERKSRPIKTTFELVDIIKASLPVRELNKKGHPAKQVFQALRIEVNDELGALKQVLLDSSEMLNVGGRIVVITFHSLEDRIVKNIFRDLENRHQIDSSIPILPNQIIEDDFKVITRRPITASKAEIENNRRAKSAKMRIIERIR